VYWSKVTGPAEIAALRRLIDDGASVTQAGRTLKISRSTAYAALASTRSPVTAAGLLHQAVLPQARGTP
jgi:predicted DNA-binding protein (UPF0251 family)